MKELKAIEILQEYKALMEYDAKAYGYEANTKGVDEALAELSELTQEKSCEGCEHPYINPLDDGRYGKPKILGADEMPNHWTYCRKLKKNISKDFFCAYYTPKG